MIPMEPAPEDLARQLTQRRAHEEQARAISHLAHSRTGLLTRYLRRIVDRIDPIGAARRRVR